MAILRNKKQDTNKNKHTIYYKTDSNNLNNNELQKHQIDVLNDIKALKKSFDKPKLNFQQQYAAAILQYENTTFKNFSERLNYFRYWKKRLNEKYFKLLHTYTSITNYENTTPNNSPDLKAKKKVNKQIKLINEKSTYFKTKNFHHHNECCACSICLGNATTNRTSLSNNNETTNGPKKAIKKSLPRATTQKVELSTFNEVINDTHKLKKIAAAITKYSDLHYNNGFHPPSTTIKSSQSHLCTFMGINYHVYDTSNPDKLLKSRIPLDKLAQLPPTYSHNDFKESKDKLFKKAMRKYFANGLAFQLKRHNPKSPLLKSYLNTFYCQNLLQQKGATITAAYCKNRWCIQCNKIRTAHLINGYQKQLDTLENPQFITLTRPNVKKEHLHDEIRYYIKTWQDIKKSLKEKQGYAFVGIRKLECTYNANTNTYHPHFHIVVSGGIHASNLIRGEWLMRNPTALGKGQDTRQMGNAIELFKYFTKIVTTTKIKTSVNKSKSSINRGRVTTYQRIYPQALDTIFQAIKGCRIYQPFGIQQVCEDDEKLFKQEFSSLLQGSNLRPSDISEDWLYDIQNNDWVNQNTGECLTNYKPSLKQNKLVNKSNEVLDWDNATLQPSLIDVKHKHSPPKIIRKHKVRKLLYQDLQPMEHAPLSDLPIKTRLQTYNYGLLLHDNN